MIRYPTVNPLYRKEMDRTIKILETIKRYETSLSVELMRRYCKEYLKELEKIKENKYATVD